MTDFFFDLPIWFPIALFVVAIGVFIYGNNRSNAQLRLASLGIVVLTVGLVALSYFVDTFEEKCVKRTHGLIAAVNAKDWTTFKSLLNEQTTVVVLRGPDAISLRAQQLAEEFGLRNVRILNTNTRGGDAGLMDVTVLVNYEINQPTPPTMPWVFQYEQRADGTLLSNIAPAGKDGAAAEATRRIR